MGELQSDYPRKMWPHRKYLFPNPGRINMMVGDERKTQRQESCYLPGSYCAWDKESTHKQAEGSCGRCGIMSLLSMGRESTVIAHWQPERLENIQDFSWTCDKWPGRAFFSECQEIRMIKNEWRGKGQKSEFTKFGARYSGLLISVSPTATTFVFDFINPQYPRL